MDERRYHAKGVDQALDTPAHLLQPLGGKPELGADARAFARGVGSGFTCGHVSL